MSILLFPLLQTLLNSELTLAVGTLILLVLVVYIITFFFRYRKAQLHFEIEKEQLKRALLQTKVEIREQSMIDVSRDLHDHIGQLAALLKITLSQMAMKANEEYKTKLEEPIAQSKQLISDIKRISASLNGSLLEKQGLVAAIQADVDRINRIDVLQLAFKKPKEELFLTNKTAIFIYRITQECLTNILSHAEATEAGIKLNHTVDNLYLSIYDNGKGFKKKESNGSGLRNIKERCSLLKAQLNVESTDGMGTKIEIIIPMKNNENGK